MNPRRIHDLMRESFPPIEHAKREWVVVQNEQGPNQAVISSLLASHISEGEVLVEVHRKVGALLPTEEAASYICSQIGQGEIRVSNRSFTGFVVIAVAGVATGWHRPANPSLQATASGRA